MPVSVALVRLLADGSVTVMAGSTEVGQGARTVLSQIAAEELSVPMTQITMQGTDTLFKPFDHSTGASRSTVMGNAVKAAAQELRQQIIDDDAEALKVNVQEIQLKNGEVICGEHRLS